MITVHKYTVPFADEFDIEMPAGALLLSYQNQRECGVLYAKVDTSRPERKRYFRLAGTGHDISEGLEYVGSAQFREGSLAFHLFERP